MIKINRFTPANQFAMPYLALFSLIAFSVSCAGAVSKNVAQPNSISETRANADAKPRGATIDIDANGPADTVRVFYKLLREHKFREAFFLTNLRPAIESLTENELKDFSLDFEEIAGQIPAEIEINGEIISGDTATVTANLPNADGDANEIQQIKLKKTNSVWIIQSLDDDAERRARAEGKQYFYNLRIETHEDEASKMLERIAKAQVAYSLQNNGICGDLQTLVTAGLVPPDALSSLSTGYNYVLKLTDNGKRYFATATPAEYGKSGKRSFLLEIDAKGLPHVSSKENGGQPIKK